MIVTTVHLKIDCIKGKSSHVLLLILCCRASPSQYYGEGAAKYL